MHRIFALLLCFCLLTVPVFADNAAASVSTAATVSSTGSCRISLTAEIRLDEPVPNLTFPLGTGVTNVTLNGERASTVTVGDVTHVRLPQLSSQTGTYSVNIQYTLDNVVEMDSDNRQVIRVLLLAGFKYPVEHLDFSVVLPQAFTDSPEFFSGYHQQDIEKNMEIQSEPEMATVIGSTSSVLKDSETLYMVLDAPKGMFPLAVVAGESLQTDRIGMGLCMALALLYWLLKLRRRPIWPGRRPLPPQGLSAGNVGSYLVHADANLTLMIMQWAQMGYLEIRLDSHRRVFLTRKMEMGNERSPEEIRCFRALFRRKQQLEATSADFVRLQRKVAAASRKQSFGLLKKSGNPSLFRFIACGAGVFAGIAMGDCIGSPSAVIRIVWMSVLAVFCAFACWCIQRGLYRLISPDRRDLRVSLVLCAAVIVIACLCNAPGYGFLLVFWALLSGLLAAYGGRRTESGRQMFQEILGLRRFLRNVSPNELQRILRSNPDYYYEMAPFALALGVDTRFARRFGSIQMGSCKWLITNRPAPKNPAEWCMLLRKTAYLMDRSLSRPLWKVLLNID